VDGTVAVTSVVEVRVDRRTEVALTTVVDVTIDVDGKTDVKVRILVDARAVRVSVTRTVLVMRTVAWTISVAEIIFVEVATTIAGSDAGASGGELPSSHSPRPS
jgi:hypothetical protein